MHHLFFDQLRKATHEGGIVDYERLFTLISETYGEHDRAIENSLSKIHALNTTLKKERHAMAAQIEHRFELAIESASDGVWDWDIETNTLWFSSRCKKMLGYDPHQLTACSIEDWYKMVHPEDAEKARQFIREHLETEERQAQTLRFTHTAGAVFYFMCRASVSYDENGRASHIVGVHTNITDLIAMQEELAVARDRAEAASHAKSDFLANMSHEIRSPMNAIMGMTGLLLETPLDPQQRLWAEIVRNSSELLLDIINDILDISKIEAEKLALEHMPFDLFEIIEHATDALIFKAQEKNIELLTSYAPDTPRYLIGDPTRLRQIIINLVGNAIKFTHAGYVMLSVNVKVAEQDKIRLLFEIEDTGIGIPPDKLEYIFEKFSQADSSTTRKFGGTGLGLAICRRLVQRMEGNIGVRSAVGKGSLFHFDICLLLDQSPLHEKQTAPPDLANLKIMVVDDNVKSLEILKRYFTSWGMRNECHSLSEPALQSLKRAKKQEDNFNMVMVDYHLQGMNGKHFATEVKKLGIPGLQLIAIKSGEPGNLVEMRDAGFLALVIKPFTPSLLMNKLAMLWMNRAAVKDGGLLTRYNLQHRNRATPAAPLADFSDLKVMIVEDIKANQIYLQALLKKYNCVPDVAANGKEAVDKARLKAYDVIFMDCQMPEMDGYQATRAIRSLPLPGRPFIIALTADAMQGDRERCLASGMDEYLNKPVKAEKIAAMLEHYVQMQREKRAAS